MELNRRAVDVMAKANVPTVDLHAAVVAKCGPVPQKECARPAFAPNLHWCEGDYTT